MDNRRRWLALIVLCLGDLMIVLDATIVNVALPSIRERPRLLADLARVGRERLPADVRRLPAARRRLGDLYGHRRLFLVGIALFTARSLAAARDHAGLLVARARCRARRRDRLGRRALADHDALHRAGERAKAMGVFGFVAAGGGSIGVLLGGILTDSSTGTGSSSSTSRSASRRRLCARLLPAGAAPATGDGSTSAARSR
jgi:MFS family permease